MKQPELGKKIAALRNEQGLTQEELVEKCNISVRTIQRIEAGEVTPRHYTIRMILEALGQNPEQLGNTNEVSSGSLKQMQVGWIAGILYFLLAIPEGLMDYQRWENAWVLMTDGMTFSAFGYIAVKLLVAVTFFYFMRGFVRLGEYLADDLLRITSHLLVGMMILTMILDISSLYLEVLEDGIYLFPVSFCFGILGIGFGVALLRLRNQLGTVVVLAGAMEIVAGVCFLFFFPLGLLILAFAEIFEIITLYRGRDLASRRVNAATGSANAHPGIGERSETISGISS